MEDIERMQGTWEMMTLEVEGVSQPAEMFTGTRIIIKGDTFASVTKEAFYAGSIKLQSRESPKRIDLIFTAGPEQGNISAGIYELEGDDLRICLGFAGVDRPKLFLTRAESGHALETLKRAT